MKKLLAVVLIGVMFLFFSSSVFAQTLETKKKAEKSINELYQKEMNLASLQIDKEKKQIDNLAKLDIYRGIIMHFSKKNKISSYKDIAKLTNGDKDKLLESLRIYCQKQELDQFLTEELEILEEARSINSITALFILKYFETGDEELFKKIERSMILEFSRLKANQKRLDEKRENLKCSQSLQDIFDEAINKKPKSKKDYF
jgi:hypothetical protein